MIQTLPTESKVSELKVRPRALLVDLDGTLYPALPVRLAMAAELLLGNWSKIVVLKTFRQEHERVRNEPGEDNPYHTQLRRTAQRLNQPLASVEAVVLEWMQRRPGKWLRYFRRHQLLRTIRGFRREGGRTALVSDYPAAAKLAALDAAECFDVVVASGEWPSLTRLKPSPQGYLAAAEQLHVPPAECLVIGDRDDTDGAAARSAGMQFMKIAFGRKVRLPVASPQISAT
ncbi:MAG: HAD family hydrolase [Planctomycetes bacterium]|nr:HAD family hydrolase [Planctomycetota bacterium]